LRFRVQYRSVDGDPADHERVEEQLVVLQRHHVGPPLVVYQKRCHLPTEGARLLLEGCKIFYLKDKAMFWSRPSYICHIRSTAEV